MMVRRLFIVLGVLLGAAPWLGGPTWAEPVEQPPIYTGPESARGVVGQLGGVFLLSGPRCQPMIVIPAGVFDGSYEFEFRLDNQRPPPDVREGFRRVGPAVRFSGAVDASDRPIEFSIRHRALSGEPVLAVEYPDLCADQVLAQSRLCSRWRVLPTRHFRGRLRARIPVTAGMGLQFGVVPRGVRGHI